MWLDRFDRPHDPRHRVSTRNYIRNFFRLTLLRISCRLPQTPRTPSVGMAHYFDDVFHRTAVAGKDKFVKPQMRRSSTARSIGARSDFDTSVNGDDDEDTASLGNSVTTLDPERDNQRKEADAHMHNYISEQLERVKTDLEHNGYNLEDEYETHA